MAEIGRVKLFQNDNTNKKTKKFVSVLGDSISTYKGFTADGYKIYYDEYQSARNEITSVYDIWWAKVNQYLHAYICVNNSYSGSKVSGERFPSANCQKRTSSLHTDKYLPDIILIYIGFNDFGNGINIVENICMNNGESFYQSYLDMLLRIKQNYPQSTIICGTLMKSCIKDRSDWKFPEKWSGISINDYNTAIKIACKTAQVGVADLASLDMRYETLDGAHPTKNGHITMSKAWIECLNSITDKKLRSSIF